MPKIVKEALTVSLDILITLVIINMKEGYDNKQYLTLLSSD